jgi:hypothetical protein
VSGKCLDVGGTSHKERGDLDPTAVADAKPEDLWRKAVKEASLSEVIIFRDDHEFVDGCPLPDRVVGRRAEAKIAYVERAGEQGREVANESRRKVLVEEEPNAHRPSQLRGGIGDEAALAVSRKAVDGEEVVVLEVREVREDLRLGHPGGQIRQDVVDRDAQAPDARLAPALPRLDGYTLGGVHEVDSRVRSEAGQASKDSGAPAPPSSGCHAPPRKSLHLDHVPHASRCRDHKIAADLPGMRSTRFTQSGRHAVRSETLADDGTRTRLLLRQGAVRLEHQADRFTKILTRFLERLSLGISPGHLLCEGDMTAVSRRPDYIISPGHAEVWSCEAEDQRPPATPRADRDAMQCHVTQVPIDREHAGAELRHGWIIACDQ